MVLWEKSATTRRAVASPRIVNFATRLNVGFARTRGDVVVFLNNDRLGHRRLARAARRRTAGRRAGAVQPKLLYPDGTVQSDASRSPRRG